MELLARCQPGALRTLSRKTWAGNIRRFELLRRVLARAMQAATSPCAAELKLVEVGCGLRDAARRLAWLAGLRAAFKAERHCVAGLPAR